MRKYRNKYRVESARLPLWDYANPGYYFVTICAKDRVPYFGQIDQGRMHLSPVGEIVVEEWQKTATIRDNVDLDAWVIMPNHIHGIVIITDTADGRNHPTRRANGRRWKPGVLGSIINQFKGACTRAIRQRYNPEFSWQSRFYDHIIRDERSLDHIRSYIDDNPLKWELDDLYIVIPPDGVMAPQPVETPRRGVSTDAQPFSSSHGDDHLGVETPGPGVSTASNTGSFARADDHSGVETPGPGVSTDANHITDPNKNDHPTVETPRRGVSTGAQSMSNVHGADQPGVETPRRGVSARGANEGR